jgi:hypothetical protein
LTPLVVWEEAFVPPWAMGKMPVKRLKPIDEVAISLLLLSRARREEAAGPVNQAFSVEKLVELAAVRFERASVVEPEKMLLSPRSVEDAAVTVIDVPTGKLVPLMVPREPVKRLVPIEVVETIWLFAFNASKVEAD